MAVEFVSLIVAVVVALVAATPPTLMGLLAVRRSSQARSETTEILRNVGDTNGEGSISTQIEFLRSRLDRYCIESNQRQIAVDRRIDIFSTGVTDRFDALVARIDAHEGREFARHDQRDARILAEIKSHHPDAWDGTERRLG